MLDYIFVIAGVSFLTYLFAKLFGNIRITILIDQRKTKNTFTRTGVCIRIPNPLYPKTKFLHNTSIQDS